MTSGKPGFPKNISITNLMRYAGKLIVFGIMFGLACVYRAIVQIRLALYRRGLLITSNVPCPVISIGNITTGGTGKTPMVILVAGILQRHNKRVAVLSRGYRRKGPSHTPVIIPAGGQDIAVETVGDEPLLIAQKIAGNAGAPMGVVIVGSKRAQSAQLALDQLHPDVLVLDDGFQHVQLSRTCDIVLVDATNPFGGGYMLPAGFLREPLANLRRAHIFVITRSDEVNELEPIRAQLRQVNPDAPIFTAQHAFAGIRNIVTNEQVEQSNLISKRVLAVSGLANPASFHRLLREQDLCVVEMLDFPDHHWFSEQDIERIRRIIANWHLDAIITTEKDEARLGVFVERLNVPLYAAAIMLRVEPAREFEDLLLAYSQRP